MCATRVQREMPHHLYRPSHGRSHNWYVRLVPPKNVQHLTGPKEFRKSTGTADLKRAKTIGAQLVATKRAEWDQLLAKNNQPDVVVEGVLTQPLIDYVCAKRLHQWMHVDDLGRFEGEGMTDETLSKLTQICEVTDEGMRSVLVRGKKSEDWLETMELVDFWCVQIGYKFSQTDPFYPALVREFARVEIEGQGRVMKRNRGEFSETPPLPPQAATLSALTEIYRAHKQQDGGSKHVGTSVNIWKMLISNSGDVPLDAVKASDLYEFLSARMHADSKPWSMKYAQGPVKRTLREVFALARTRSLMTGSNPVDDLEIMPRLPKAEEAARKKPRYPFTSAQLTILFSSGWYIPTSERWRGKMREDLGARYWVPLVCMLHGNRVREVLQLVASDVVDLDATPVIQFRAELDGEQAAMLAAGVTRSLKNDPTRRTIPLHPTLVELGFLEFVGAQRKIGGVNGMLFPSSLPKLGGKSPVLGRSYEQAFLRFVRDELNFGRGFGNHSFRHQLEDRIRDAQTPGHQWPPGLAQAYTGRKRVRNADIGYIAIEGSESAYGRGHSPVKLLPYIKMISFGDVTLPPNFGDWHGKRGDQ